MSISRLAAELKESATLAMTDKARMLRDKGEPVISMAAGEPTRQAPRGAVDAGIAELDTGHVHYTPPKGIPSLRRAIVEYTEKFYNKTVGVDNVIATAGAKQALYNLMVTLVNPGEQVVVLAPYWVSYPEIVKLAHGEPIIVEPPEGSVLPRMEDIEAAVTDATRAIIVNSPNNPSGAVYPPELIGRMVSFCEKNNIYMIMDDIYHRLVFDDVKAVSVFDYAKDQSDDSPLIVVNGVSKSYAMTGFRIGWVVANKQLIAALAKVVGQSSTCLSGVLQKAATAALIGDQDTVEDFRKTLQNNRNIIMPMLDEIAGVNCAPPDGTFYCLPDFRVFEQDDVKLADFLLEKALVVTVPGCEFGAPGHLRLTYCGNTDDIKDAVTRIRWALDPKSPKEIQIGDNVVTRTWG
jgi:aspartate aminotransferase